VAWTRLFGGDVKRDQPRDPHGHQPPRQSTVARSVRSAALATVVACSASVATLALTSQTGDKPAASLSYTEEQSTRGEAIYTKSCGFCHDDKSMAPLLQGETFVRNWSDKNAGALFDKIQVTMPLNEPGTLTGQQSADLVAYILKLNHFPAGQEVLPRDPAVLGALSLSIK
jgi:mono/diheme cytochrome c family protein